MRQFDLKGQHPALQSKYVFTKKSYSVYHQLSHHRHHQLCIVKS